MQDSSSQNFIQSFNFNKKLGQNFLVDEGVKERIFKHIRSFALSNMQILEIGPGIGAITSLLMNHYPTSVIEIDPKICAFLKTKYNNKLTIWQNDALKIDWSKITNPETTIIFSNTPYSITTALITKFISQKSFNTAIYLMQLEVFERIVASINSKKYAAYSVFVQTFLQVELLDVVAPSAFYPEPKVDSALCSLVRKEDNYDWLDVYQYWKFLSKCFLMRRKTLFNNLKSFCNKKTIDFIFNKLELNLNVRAQELSYEQFLVMFKIYQDEN